jgi:hypothetical protein
MIGSIQSVILLGEVVFSPCQKICSVALLQGAVNTPLSCTTSPSSIAVRKSLASVSATLSIEETTNPSSEYPCLLQKGISHSRRNLSLNSLIACIAEPDSPNAPVQEPKYVGVAFAKTKGMTECFGHSGTVC